MIDDIALGGTPWWTGVTATVGWNPRNPGASHPSSLRMTQQSGQAVAWEAEHGRLLKELTQEGRRGPGG